MWAKLNALGVGPIPWYQKKKRTQAFTIFIPSVSYNMVLTFVGVSGGPPIYLEK